MQMSKRITVVTAESGKHHDLVIEPATTPRDILSKVGLDDRYVLTKGRGQEPFGETENVYEQVLDGAKLYATTPVEVGGLLEYIVGDTTSDAPDSNRVRFATGGISTLASPTGRTAAALMTKMVPRQEQAYWEQRGWQKSGKSYEGYYRTRFGSWRGKAEVSWSGKINLFIHNAPKALERHHKWECFLWRPGGWRFIHNFGISDLSSGILEVERLIAESFEDELQAAHR